MKKKAIFGGTFDPIHIGHLHIAYKALYDLKLDEIIFVPSGNPPHKDNKKVTDSKLRYDMVKKAIENEDRFSINDYEIKKQGLSYTYETLDFFNELEKNTKWYFITGVDCLMDIEKWKNVSKILSKCKFIVFNRPGYNIYDILDRKSFVENKYNKKIEFLDIPILDISSTYIREMIGKGEKVYYILPNGVDTYIRENNLYI
ncbi:nicotinate-nucleotide adenylyltransferase [Haloimpatiens sp. FM7315]|uniref:nicotinate-nucleotide adenylyltransferase n=1 Tax=Haloimpatiens sp. FM7315 TaxID=3298609 RepID=UPI0035A27A30